uniref:Putative secreted protein n=1 Tax=Ixodes ricinus TaxID=34613 RepID=A0A6B0UHU5_IXORI
MYDRIPRSVCACVVIVAFFVFVCAHRTISVHAIVQTFVNQRQLQERQGAVSRNLTCFFFFSHRARNRTSHFLPKKVCTTNRDAKNANMGLTGQMQ